MGRAPSGQTAQRPRLGSARWRSTRTRSPSCELTARRRCGNGRRGARRGRTPAWRSPARTVRYSSPPRLDRVPRDRDKGRGSGHPVHDLRHTCATLVLAADVPMKVVSDRPGHSTMVLTAFSRPSAKEAARRIANACSTRERGRQPRDRNVTAQAPSRAPATDSETQSRRSERTRAEGEGFEPSMGVTP